MTGDYLDNKETKLTNLTKKLKHDYYEKMTTMKRHITKTMTTLTTKMTTQITMTILTKTRSCGQQLKH